MDFPAANPRGAMEVIDLTGDDPEGSSPLMEPQHLPDPPLLDEDEDYMDLYQTPPRSPRAAMEQEELPEAFMPNEQAQGGFYIEIDGENVFIPDEPPQPMDRVPALPAAAVDLLRDHEIAMGLQQPELPMDNFQPGEAGRYEMFERNREVAMALEPQNMTADACLQRILEIFPDISHEYVIKLYDELGKEGDYETLPGQARLDNIIEQLAEATSYPKQEKGRRKRKRELSVHENDTARWERQDRISVPPNYNPQMRSMLKAEFPEIPVQYISDTLKTNTHFYQTYVALAEAQDTGDGTARPFGRGRPSNNLADANTIAMNTGWQPLVNELKAARSKVQAMKAERALEDAKQKAEKENLDRAIADGETSECSACFDVLPMNRQIHCNGTLAHFTCYDCALTYIKTEVGDSRCRVLCTAGCGAPFANDQLNKLSDKQLLEKLSQLQQEKDIREAGLDDLEECPFCDYKEILPPIEEDFEFRCKNPDCEQISCRRCKAVSHIPISCEQHARDSKGNSRKKIEEAMTAALVRSCNQCKKQFIKDFGCNKMRCPSCGNMQCYVCSASLKDYNHFDQNPHGAAQGGQGQNKCPLYDNVEERHAREVKEAEAAARADVLRENPDLSAEDLEINVSDPVKKADADRIGHAGLAGPPGGPAVQQILQQMQDFDLFADEFAGRPVVDRARQQQERRQQLHAQRVVRVAQEQAARRAMAQQEQQAMQARVWDGLNARQNIAPGVQQAMQARAMERPDAQRRHQVARGLQMQQATQTRGMEGQNACAEQLAQAPPQAQQPGGLLGPVQGFIPVLWNPPAVAPAAQQGQQAAPGAQQQQPQDRPGVLGRHQDRFNFGFGNPFYFGGDGAVDFDPPQQQHAAAVNAIPDLVNAAAPPPPPTHTAAQNFNNPPMPGNWPYRAQHDQANEVHHQLRALELENLRREHERRVLRQQAQMARQTQARINNRPINPHYQDYQDEARRTGQQPGQ